jgi:hypothetical protein
MVQNTRASGTPRKIIVMEEDIKFGLTEAFLKDTGKMTRQTVEEGSFTLTVTFMMVNGKMTRLMDLANPLTLMDLNMRDIGLMIKSTERVKSIGLMDLNMKETINTVKKMGMENSFGLTNRHTKEILPKTIYFYMVKENTIGQLQFKNILMNQKKVRIKSNKKLLALLKWSKNFLNINNLKNLFNSGIKNKRMTGVRGIFRI